MHWIWNPPQQAINDRKVVNNTTNYVINNSRRPLVVDYNHVARVLRPEFQSDFCYAAMTCPFHFCCCFSKHREAAENKLNACSLNKNKWKMILYCCCCCQCPTARTTAPVLQYLPAIMTNEGWLLPRVHWDDGHYSNFLCLLPVFLHVSHKISVPDASHSLSEQNELHAGTIWTTQLLILSKKTSKKKMHVKISEFNHHILFENVARLHNDSLTL